MKYFFFFLTIKKHKNQFYLTSNTGAGHWPDWAGGSELADRWPKKNAEAID